MKFPHSFSGATPAVPGRKHLAFPRPAPGRAGADPLTGLPDRAWILDRLAVDLQAAQHAGTRVAVLFLDMDDFRVVNDSLGHPAGDEVLVTVADRISGVLGAGDHAGRFGEDEFLILLPDVRDAAVVEAFAERLSAAIACELRVQGHRMVPTASIGIALSTASSTTQSLLRDTDSAMFRAKSAGRARWHFLDEETHHLAVTRMLVEEQLRDAIAAGQLVVKYQPIVALATTAVVGHEALVRWLHPTRGLVGPDQFLEVAEASRLINPIGAQVLDEACAMLSRRPDLPGTISVNVSPVQLATSGWLEGVTETLARHRVDPRRLVIELTETVAMGMTDGAVYALEALSELGVGIHLDDFGTGYSALSLLRDLPVTGVKLDIRFVHDLTVEPSKGNALVHGLGGLVADLGLIGIAEGVETQTQSDLLRAQGWQFGQGYHLARPAEAPLTHLPGYAVRG